MFSALQSEGSAFVSSLKEVQVSKRRPAVMIIDPRNEAPESFLNSALSVGLSIRQARRILASVQSDTPISAEAWHEQGIISRKVSSALEPLPHLLVEKISRSTLDGFQKLLIRLHDGLAIETVIIPLENSNAATVCLSSQVGCVMGCDFCATARLKERRNLMTWEIVEQYRLAKLHAAKIGRRVTGAVFMGMGEPFLNYSRVIAAAKILHFPVAGAISGKAITISTVGIIDKIRKFIEEGHPYRLSISIGAAIEEKRKVLLPLASQVPLSDLIEAIRTYTNLTKRKVNLAYVCIGGVNTTEEDAKALGNILRDTQVRLDLIDVTDNTGKYQPPSAEELSRFRDALRLHVCQPIARRYSGGADIQAACGTLAGS